MTPSRKNNSPNVENSLVQTINWLKCCLIVFVVLIHTYLETENNNSLYSETYGWTRNVLFLSNSMFFFISGYLFFLGFHSFSWSWFGQKLKRRVHSLLVPYLLWNSILLIVLSIGIVFVPSLRGDYIIPLQEMTPVGLFKTYFCLYSDNPSCPPLDGPFWFLRDLMILSLLCPLFFMLAKLGLWSFPIVFMATLLPFPSMSIIFFYIGAYLAMHKVDYLKFCKGHFLLSLSLFVVFMIILHYVSLPVLLYSFVYTIMSLGGMMVLAHIAYCSFVHWPSVPSKELQGSLFFVFAFHIVIARIVTKLSLVFLQSHDWASWTYFIVHGFNAIVCLALCYALYYILRKVNPKICQILGARIKKY